MKITCEVDKIIYQTAYLQPQPPSKDGGDTIAVEFRGVAGAGLIKQLKVGSTVTLSIDDAPPPPAPPK